MNWDSFVKGQAVKIYVNGGWKGGVITALYDSSCSVLWTAGGTQKITRIYDVRSIRVQ